MNEHISWRRQIVSQLLLLMAGLFVALPIIWMVTIAFDGSIRNRPRGFSLWPSVWTWNNLARAWRAPRTGISFLQVLSNSLTVAGGTALVAMVVGTTAAYAFARYRFPGRTLGLWASLLLITVPPAGLIAPFFLIFNGLGIRRSLLSLVIVYSAIAVPFAVWTVRNAVQAVPLELEEAARLEGAGAVTVFRRITLPLIVPAIAVAGFIGFALAWSEFALGWIFISDASRVTLAMTLQSMYEQSGTAWGLLSATTILVALPIVIIFYGLGHYLVAGLSLGMGE